MKYLMLLIIVISGFQSYSQSNDIDRLNDSLDEIWTGFPNFPVFDAVTPQQLTDSAAAIRADFPVIIPGGNETDPVWLSQKSGYATLPITFPPETDPGWNFEKINYATTSALSSGLATKADISHTQAISTVTNLQTSLDGKAPTTNPVLTGTIINNGAVNYGVDAQSSDTYVVTITGVTAYTAGMMVVFKAKTANTLVCTININGLGAKSILKRVSTAMATNDILANMYVLLVYDGTNFIILNPVVN